MEKENFDFNDLLSLIEIKEKTNTVNQEVKDFIKEKIKENEKRQKNLSFFDENNFFNWNISNEIIENSKNVELSFKEKIRTLEDVTTLMLMLMYPLFIYLVYTGFLTPHSAIVKSLELSMMISLGYLLSIHVVLKSFYLGTNKIIVFNKDIVQKYRNINKHFYFGEYLYQKNKNINPNYNNILKKIILENYKSQKNSFDSKDGDFNRYEKEILSEFNNRIKKYKNLKLEYMLLNKYFSKNI